MGKILFASDLDGTLIHSWKREIALPKVCVESYQGKEISYMTEHALRLLEQVIQQVLFVPVTTRSIEQYNRIDLGIVPQYALTCNGGILLQDGLVEDAWKEESRSLAEPADEEIRKGMALLRQDTNRTFEVRWIEQLFLFTKSRNPHKTVSSLKQELNLDLVDIFHNGVKVYLFPKETNKGSAVKRLKERQKADLVLAAGDSFLDVPMLQAADAGYCPQKLLEERNCRKLSMGHVTGFSEGDFTAKVLKTICNLAGT